MASNNVKINIQAENHATEGTKAAIKDLLGLEEASKKVGDTIKDAFAILTVIETLKKLGEFAADCGEKFGEGERAALQLRTALNGNETSFQRNSALIDELCEKTLGSKDAIEGMVGELASLGMSDKQIDKVSRAAVSLSNVTGKDLQASMQLLIATYDGSVGKLGKLIPEMNNLTSSELAAGNAIDIVNEKFEKISNAMSNGYAQKTHNMALAFDELQESIGRSSSKTFSPLIDAITEIAKAWTESTNRMLDYEEAKDRIASGSKDINARMTVAGTEADISQTKLQKAFINWQQTHGEDLSSIESYKKTRKGGIFNPNPSTQEGWSKDYNQQLVSAGIAELAKLRNEAFSRLATVQKEYDSLLKPKGNDTDLKPTKIKEDETTKALNSLSEELTKLEISWRFNTVETDLQTDQLQKLSEKLAYIQTLKLDADATSKLNALVTNMAKAAEKIGTKPYNYVPELNNGNPSGDQNKDPTLNPTSMPDTGSEKPAGYVPYGLIDESRRDSVDPEKQFKPLMDLVSNISSQGIGGGIISSISSLLSQGLGQLAPILSSSIGSMISALAPAMSVALSSALAATGVGILLAMLAQVVTGLLAVLGPAIDSIIAPLINGLQDMGKWIGQLIIPILNSLAPLFVLVANILGEALAPSLQILIPFIEIICQILQAVLIPTIKGIAIAFEVIISPIRFLGDLFTWVGKVIQDFGFNVGKIVDNIINLRFNNIAEGTKSTAGEFKSDAFTGLEDRIKKILNEYNVQGADWSSISKGMYTDIAQNTTQVSTSGTAATYQSQVINVNIYQQAPVVGDGGLSKFAQMIREQIDQRMEYGH